VVAKSGRAKQQVVQFGIPGCCPANADMIEPDPQLVDAYRRRIEAFRRAIRLQGVAAPEGDELGSVEATRAMIDLALGRQIGCELAPTGFSEP
jgi:hypothetical protein